MEKDKYGGQLPASDAVGAVAEVDERRPPLTSGMSGRLTWTAAAGLLVFFLSLLAVRYTRTGVWPPWVEFGLYGAASQMAIVAMVLVGRMAARPRVQPEPVEAPLSRFLVETSRGRRTIPAHQVQWLEAQGNYARLHLPNEALLYRLPLARLEQRLDAQKFVRVHRSAIVNLDAVVEISPLASGDAELILASGARVRMSRRYSRRFKERAGRAH